MVVLVSTWMQSHAFQHSQHKGLALRRAPSAHTWRVSPIARSTAFPPLRSKVEEEEETNEVAEALSATATSVAAAGAFALGIAQFRGVESAVEFVTGYLLEQSLSVDNLFVFLLIFEYFKVPVGSQKRVLSWGIIGTVILRALFIGIGAVALEESKGVLLLFAGVLGVSSFKLLFTEEEEEEDLSENGIVQFATQLVDSTDSYDGDRFFTVVDDVRKATPLLLVLVCIELTDVVFAVDSVPAVFGVTQDPFIVFTSNIFAIAGLRSLYTILATAVQDLEYLQPAVAIILGFVGGKLAAEFFGYNVSNEVSLGVIISLLSGGVALSLATKEE